MKAVKIYLIFSAVLLTSGTLTKAYHLTKKPQQTACRSVEPKWRRSKIHGRNIQTLSAIPDKSGNAELREKVDFQLHSSITNIPPETWDSCLKSDGSSSPFLEHAWLRCLEESKCASPETGWIPQHVSILVDGKAVGFVPLYIKGHSMGEFIFDNSWAEAALANGIEYYPKLLVGVPFTPATGERVLLHPTVLEQYSRVEITCLRVLVASFLKQIATSNKISSVHLNFLMEEEATDIAGELKPFRLQDRVQAMLERLKYTDKDDYLRRTSLQYHWKNANSKNDGKPYKSFDEYLGCFKSKRRITIRREREKVKDDENIRIDAVVGKDILKHDGLVERMFEIYLSTIDKMIWGRQYLTLEFFELLAKSDFVDNICFMCARKHSSGEKLKSSDVFAGTFNIVKNGVFYGRYWGCLSELKNLHFEVCYWSSIEHCIKNGLRRMEPGAGGGGKNPNFCDESRCYVLSCVVEIASLRHFLLQLSVQ
jgi:predicted N-acyltransferase